MYQGYLMAIPTLRARTQLGIMEVMDYPHIKSESRSSLHKELHKRAYPNHKPKALTTDQISELFGG